MFIRQGQHKRRHTGMGGSACCQPSDDPEDEGASAVDRIWLHAAVEPGWGNPDDDSSLVKLNSSRVWFISSQLACFTADELRADIEFAEALSFIVTIRCQAQYEAMVLSRLPPHHTRLRRGHQTPYRGRARHPRTRCHRSPVAQ